MEINGLPLHPLLVHAAVVLGPLAALWALAYVVLPGQRDRLRWGMVVLTAVALGSIVVAYLSGGDFKSSRNFFSTGPVGARVQTHEQRAGWLLGATIPFAVLALATAYWHPRRGRATVVLHGLLGLGAVAVLVLVVLTGESGARAVWGS